MTRPDFKSDRHAALEAKHPPDLKKLMSSGAMQGPRMPKPSFQPRINCRPVSLWARVVRWVRNLHPKGMK